ncbi:peptidyl-tRNA hydrolase [bacterium BMS3Abin03]|nr:peptidyl-tRNA hydrolase [bacterium BMS3Abin03]
MRAVLGIGNPGTIYQRNKHNAGFLILDQFANSKSLKFKASKGKYYIATGTVNKSDFSLIKPTTFVNNSGIAAQHFIEQHNINIEDLLVICDDINLEPGKIRVRRSGGDGGHNGLASIIYHLNSNRFPRLRIGIGNDFEEGRLSDYVLSDFTDDELKLLSESFETSKILIEEFITGGVDAMLNANSRLKNEN